MGSFRAVKVVRRSSFDHDRPFEREFEGLKKFEPISHARESQVDIFQVGRNDAAGFFYYVMELADPVETQVGSLLTKSAGPGNDANARRPLEALNPETYVPGTLKHYLRARGAMSAGECLQIASCLSTALEHLHKHGLVHRDVKPSNIIFVCGRPKLADIGLVSSVDATRSLVGTDGYIAPEGPGTPQADLYSLGKVLYECATGKDRLDFPKLPETWRGNPEFGLLLELNEIVIKACEFDPSRRYQSALEMAKDITILQHGLSVRRNRLREKRWKLVTGFAPFALMLGLATVGFLLLWPKQGHALSSNRRAQKLYSQSISLLNAGPFPETLRACSNLLEAVTLDPQFAEAYYLLASAQWSDWGDRLPPRYNQLRNFKWVAEKLRTLRPDSAQYHTVLSDLAALDWDFEKAIEEARLACKLDPRFSAAHTLYGWWMLQLRGDAATARNEFEIAEQLDFQNVLTQAMFCRIFQFERNMPMAIAQYLEVEQLESRTLGTHFFLRWAYEANHQYDKALEERRNYELATSATPEETRSRYTRYKMILEQQGHREMWAAMLNDQKTQPSPDFYDMARLSARLGYTDEVFDLLDKARLDHHGDMMKLLFDDCWDNLRDDPRFDRQLELMHLPKIKPPTK
jgi:serine/threonine protein kinase